MAGFESKLKSLEDRKDKYTALFNENMRILDLTKKNSDLLDKSMLEKSKKAISQVLVGTHILVRLPDLLESVKQLDDAWSNSEVDEDEVEEFIEEYEARVKNLEDFFAADEEGMLHASVTLQGLEFGLRTSKKPEIVSRIKLYDDKKVLEALIVDLSNERLEQDLNIKISRWNEKNLSLYERVNARKKAHKVETKGDLVRLAYNTMEDSFAAFQEEILKASELQGVNRSDPRNNSDAVLSSMNDLKKKHQAYQEARVAYATILDDYSKNLDFNGTQEKLS